jgi:acetolactate synthase-1/3 small subunit
VTFSLRYNGFLRNRLADFTGFNTLPALFLFPENVMRHVISALVMNEPGVLANVAGMFAARGFNIDSLVVGRTENPELSRMTIVVTASDNILEQVRKQLAKLVPVVKVRDFKDSAYIERDLALITVGVSPEQRNQVIELANLFRAKVVDVAKTSVIVELAGTEEKIEAFIELMKPYGITELARTGVIAVARGMQIGRENQAPDPSKIRKRSLDAPAAVGLPPS